MPETNERPNIVVILADDMGFSDIGCFGAEIRTPTLDRLGENGVRFSQFYNCARCCPTRASLLTGLGPHQAGVGHMVGDHGVGPAYQGYLRQDGLTIGEALKAGGYRTLYAGKWHASSGAGVDNGTKYPPGDPRNPYPLSRGFDRFYGTLAGCGNYFYPHGLMDQDRFIRPEDDDYYYTDAISENAAAMVREADGAPFFMHVCYTAPHWPLHARAADIEAYIGTYSKGWDHFRTARHETLKGLGVLDGKWPISPRDPDSRDFHADNAKRREWEDLRMAVYAAQVESMDRGIGRIVAALEETGALENTLIMFLSDNGGCAEFLNEDGDGTAWPSCYRHTARPGETCTVGNIQELRPGPATTFMSYDLPWANMSNTPFRLFKHWVHEGGIGTPFVCHWPMGMRGERIVHAPCHVMDIMATCLDVAGVEYPEEHEGYAIQPLEGESFAPLVAGNDDWRREREICWEHEGNRAVRAGQWKLVSRTVEGINGPWELYDMDADRTELNDLAGKYPDTVAKLTRHYDEWADRCGVLPWRKGPVRA